jgi:hypothetical protein
MVDQAYLISVADLRRLCEELQNYDLEVCGSTVSVTHNKHQLNATTFGFPIVAERRFLGAIFRDLEVGQIACLDNCVAKQVRHSLHLGEDGEVRRDTMLDWECFWTPLEALLFREKEITTKR